MRKKQWKSQSLGASAMKDACSKRRVQSVFDCRIESMSVSGMFYFYERCGVAE
jgi:hypothetical protein